MRECQQEKSYTHRLPIVSSSHVPIRHVIQIHVIEGQRQRNCGLLSVTAWTLVASALVLSLSSPLLLSPSLSSSTSSVSSLPLLSRALSSASSNLSPFHPPLSSLLSAFSHYSPFLLSRRRIGIQRGSQVYYGKRLIFYV